MNLKSETTWSSLRLLQLGRGRVLLILLVLVALVSLRVAGVASKNTITHDEGISYLAATGHQGQYNDIVYRTQHPAGAWVKSLEWKKLITPNEQFVFNRIGDDLAHFDIHPPLYFWLLHVWSLLLGVHIWTGPTLNIIIFLVTSLLLFRLAYYVLGSYSQAAIATSVWAISPAVVSTSFTARPYGLAALITVIFIDQIIRYVDLSRLPRLTEFILLSTITAAGILTQYQFLLVVVGAAIFLAVRFGRANIQCLSMGLFSIGIGCIIFVFLHPDFYLSLSRAAIQSQAFDITAVAPRVNRVRGHSGVSFCHVIPTCVKSGRYGPLFLALT